MAAADPPAYMDAFDTSEWMTYVRVRSTPEQDVWAVDDPVVLEWAEVWMRPIPLSSVDPEERPEGFTDALGRGTDGRFKPVFMWEECRQSSSGAVAYLGVRYKPREERRIEIPLSGNATMHTTIRPDVSPETLDALREIGEAAAKRMGGSE